MTRFEKLAEYLRRVGPSTTADIATAMGWKLRTASAAMSLARTYGYVAVTDTVNRDFGGGNYHLWGASVQPLIRKPGQGRTGRLQS